MMKIFKTTILTAFFFFAVMAITNANINEETLKVDVHKQKIPCSTVFTVCDLAHPDDYEMFDQCMRNNGC